MFVCVMVLLLERWAKETNKQTNKTIAQPGADAKSPPPHSPPLAATLSLVSFFPIPVQ